MLLLGLDAAAPLAESKASRICLSWRMPPGASNDPKSRSLSSWAIPKWREFPEMIRRIPSLEVPNLSGTTPPGPP
jgi:hypothetical protein